MNKDATPPPSPNPIGNPPPSNPDIWLTVITAAAQTYVQLGKAAGPVTAATISSVLEDAQNNQLISPAAAASVLELVQTSEGAALVQHSATLATHAVTFINIQDTTVVTPDQPRTYAVADQPRTYTSSGTEGTTAASPAASEPNAPPN